MIYLNSAAVVKLAHAEPESAALRGWLDNRAEAQWVSSVQTEIESLRALARYAPQAAPRLPAVLDQIDLIDLDQRIQIAGPDGHRDDGAQPGRHPPRHGLALPLLTDLVRDIWQAPARRGPGSMPAHRRARLTAITGEAAPGHEAPCYARYAARGYPETSVNLEPCQIRASGAVAFVPRASDGPSDNGPGSGSRRQTSQTIPSFDLCSSGPMRPGRTNPFSLQRRRAAAESGHTRLFSVTKGLTPSNRV